jgi:hypothetical protein
MPGTVTVAEAAFPEETVAVTVTVCWLAVAAGAVNTVVVPLVGVTDPAVVDHVTA